MHRMPALVVASTMLLAGCGSDDSGAGRDDAGSQVATPSESPAPTDSTTTATPAPAPTEASARGRVIKTAGSDFGPMLYDRSGQAIYLFEKEGSSTPACYGECAEAWPPVLTEGVPQARGDVRPALLGTTTRKDGTRQVTYAGHPLYFYAHEEPNQVLCHDVSQFGALWLVVTPSGAPAA